MVDVETDGQIPGGSISKRLTFQSGLLNDGRLSIRKHSEHITLKRLLYCQNSAILLHTDAEHIL